MNILQISNADIGGGAERVAWDLHHAYLERGHNTLLIVGDKRSEMTSVEGLNPTKRSLAWIGHKLLRRLEYWTGIQAMGYWHFRQWWRENWRGWDVVHLHNLHSSFFDLSVLEEISRTTPLVQTLHDCWQFTGHCAHPMACDRWRIGCGSCPDLSTYPAVKTDMTRFNWQRKRKFHIRASPTLVVPSRWLQKKVASSFLRDLNCELIYNGIDTARFLPGNRSSIRSQIDLPLDKNILLYVANKGLNAKTFKDPDLLLKALRILIYERQRVDVLLVVVGGKVALPIDLSCYVMQREDVREGIEKYYQAADVYLHPSKADNCPLVILEAMACGLPVISTDVGGIGEIVLDGLTGSMVTPGDPAAFADAIAKHLNSGTVGACTASLKRDRLQFSVSQMADSYLAVYKKRPFHYD